jgi:thiamine-phosphate pyrophosphorylase
MEHLLTLLSRFERRPSACRRSALLSPLLVLSDDARGFGLEGQLSHWPMGAAFIERTYGAAPRQKHISDTAQLASCTPRQARAAKLDGVHWPQKRLKFRQKSATQGLLETTSSHSGLAIAKASRAGFDAILVSTAFESESPSATRPLGAIRLAILQRMFPSTPIYALGGISLNTIKKLRRTRISGVALVSFKETQN